jgi:hypothetical protein
MDFSVRRIESNPTRGVGPPRRRRRDGEGEFDLELAEEQPAEPAPSESSAPHRDTPVAPPSEDDVGGRIDLTA